MEASALHASASNKMKRAVANLCQLFQYFFRFGFLQDGNISGATAILEHMKEQDMTVNEQVFHSLIYGHSKLGDTESADRVMTIMEESGLEIDFNAHTPKLIGMIENGKSFGEVNNVISDLKDKGILLDDRSYFDLMLAFTKQGQKEAARTLAESLPRNAGYFNLVRNYGPQFVQFGDHELAFLILQTFRGTDTIQSKVSDQSFRGNGIFNLRAMIFNEYEPEEVARALKEYNSDAEGFEACIPKCYDAYFVVDNLEKLVKFHSIVKGDLNQRFYLSDSMNAVYGALLSRNVISDAGKFLNFLQLADIPVSANTISRLFLTRMYDKAGTFSIASELLEAKRSMDGHYLNFRNTAAAYIIFGLNKNEEMFGREVTNLLLSVKGQFIPQMWTLSLARHYLTVRDLDLLKTCLITQTSLDQLFLSEGNEPARKNDNLFKSLEVIHERSGKYVDENPESILEDILKSFDEDNLGIPEAFVQSLSNAVQNENTKDLLVKLGENFKNFDKLWTKEKMTEYLEEIKTRNHNLRSFNYLRSNRNQRAMSPRKVDDMSQIDLERKVLSGIRENSVNVKAADLYLRGLLEKSGDANKVLEIVDQVRSCSGSEYFAPSYVLVDMFIKQNFAQNGNFLEVISDWNEMARKKYGMTMIAFDNTFFDAAVEIASKGNEEEALKVIKTMKEIRGGDDPENYNIIKFIRNISPLVSNPEEFCKALNFNGTNLLRRTEYAHLDQLFVDGKFDELVAKRQEMNQKDPSVSVNFQLIDEYLKKKMETLGNFESAMEELFKDLKWDKDSNEILYSSTALDVVVSLLKAGNDEEAFKVLQYLQDNNNLFKAKDMNVQMLIFLRQMEGHIKDTEQLEKIMSYLEHYDGAIRGLQIKHLVFMKEPELALQKFEEISRGQKRTPFLKELVMEFMDEKDQKKMQRLLESSVSAKGEEVSMYDFVGVFLEAGKFSKAKLLLGSAGLRYNPMSAARICRKLENSPQAKEEFIKHATAIFGSDHDYLFNQMIDMYKDNPDKITDTYVLMQERSFIPPSNMLNKMAAIYRKHQKVPPFDVGEFDIVENKRSQPLTETTRSKKHNEELTRSFGAARGKEDLDRMTNILLEGLDSSKAHISWIQSTVELMISRQNYERIGEICEGVAKSASSMRSTLKQRLDRMPMETLEKLDLSETTQSNLAWDVYLVNRRAKEVPDLPTVFKTLSAEQVAFLRYLSLESQVKSEADANLLKDKVTEINNERFTLAVFKTLILKGFGSKAVEIWTQNIDQKVDAKLIEAFFKQKATKAQMQKFAEKEGLKVPVSSSQVSEQALS